MGVVDESVFLPLFRLQQKGSFPFIPFVKLVAGED